MKKIRSLAVASNVRTGLVAGVLLAAAGPATAQQVEIAVSAGATHTDNVGRVAADETSETIATAGLAVALQREGSRLDADVAADLQWRKYLDDTFGDEVVGGLAGTLVFSLVPDRLTWTVQDNYGQTLVDRRFAETPDNRQDTNVFSTGPDLYFLLGERTRVELSARWSDVAYEDTAADSERYSGTLGLVRALSSRSSLGLNGTFERIEFDDSTSVIDSDYDRVSGYASFRVQGARTEAEFRGGYTKVDGASRSYDAPLLGLSLTRQLGARSTVELNAGTNLTDAADEFARGQALAGVDAGTGTVAVSQDPMQSDYLSLGLSVEGARTNLRVGIDWSKDEQENLSSLDRERLGGSLLLTRQMTRRLTARLFGGYATEEIGLATDFDEWVVGAGLEWALSDTLSVALQADRNEGSGDTGVGSAARDYVENRVALTITYSPRR